jgi:hypothetical protein
MKVFARIALAILVILASVAEAFAHTRSETQSVWRIVGATVHVAYTIPDIEIPRLAHPNGAPLSEAELTDYVRQNVMVLHRGQSCERTEDVRPIAASAGFKRFEFGYQCPDAEGMSIHSSGFFSLVPTHVTYAQIITDKGDFISQLLTATQQTLELSSASGKSALQNASFLEYVAMGIMHIFSGYDHQVFLLGLVLISKRLRDLVFVITGFTIGHSVTLALATTGVIRPHAEYIDALIGLTIALIAAENIGDSNRRSGTLASVMGSMLLLMALGKMTGFGGLPVYLLVGTAIFAVNYLMLSGHLKDAARLRLVVTLVFGLIHGFGFAANLLDMQLPRGRLAELLVGFNLGVEIGQLTLVCVLVSAVWLLSRMKLTLPRPIVVDVASACVAGVGLYWFVSRSYA